MNCCQMNVLHTMLDNFMRHANIVTLAGTEGE